MLRLLLLPLLILSLSFINQFHAQNGFTDGFNDGDFNNNPTWIGDTNKFTINSSNQLQLNDTSKTSPAYLISNSTIVSQGVWEFFVELDFAPSTSNYSKVYLVSDQQNLDSSLNGYYVRIGGQTGTVDDVSLYRQSGNSTIKIIDGVDGTVASNPRLKIMVTRDPFANWELFIDTSQVLNQYVSQGKVTDSTHSKSNYAGVYCKYTSTRSDKFFFDDFKVNSIEFIDSVKPFITDLLVLDRQTLELTVNEPIDSISTKTLSNYTVNNGIGNPQVVDYKSIKPKTIRLSFLKEFENAKTYQLITSNIEDLDSNVMLTDTMDFTYSDTINPFITNFLVIDKQTLELTFSEAVDSISTQNLSNYTINNGIGNPQSVIYGLQENKKLLLSFLNEFDNATDYQLVTSNIEDRDGNIMLADTNNFFFFIENPANYRDIVINELFPDITPSVGLPEVEFIELFNASNKVFNLEGWTLSDGGTPATLESEFFKPGEFLIICSNSMESEFQNFAPTQGLSSFPGLNNDMDHIQLYDQSGILIDEVFYTDDWYKDNLKSDGGYTLEQINPYTECTGTINFAASNANIGGTPGSQNSIFDSLPDSNPPSVLKYSVESNNTIVIDFNESIDTNSININSFIFSPTKNIANVKVIGPEFRSIQISLNDYLDSSVTTIVGISDIKDCEGNSIQPNTKISFLLPNSALSNDIIINEILFNPRTGGSDFVELYNRSNKIFSIKNLRIANEDESVIDNIKLISEEEYLFYPGEYVGITEDINNIRAEYTSTRSDRFIEVDALPSYNNDKGTVFILNDSGKVIDYVYYHEDFHFELLDDVNGVSLERLSSERPSNDPTNFHSASEASGFATPGYENSQSFQNTRFSGKVTIDPETFSPDNDGFQDILNINYQFNNPGFVANIEIFDRNGRLVKNLIKNQLLGSKGTFSWDGITDDGTKARIGIYVVYFDAFHPNGKQEAFKKVVVVAGKL